MSTKELHKIVEEWLGNNGYDGLCHPDNKCACAVGELMPCGEPMTNCAAGHKQEAPPESEYDFVIVPDGPDEN